MCNGENVTESRWTLIFSVAFAVLLITPALFSGQFIYFPLMKYGDLIDLLTPLILIPLYWVLFRSAAGDQPGWGGQLGFLVLVGLWVEGQGMHLAANSIGHLVDRETATDTYALTYFFDEILSHYMWHSAAIALSGLIIWREWRWKDRSGTTNWGLTAAAGLLHGLTYFMIFTEGNTAPIGLPYALGITLLSVIFGRRTLNNRPIGAFFFTAYLSATVFFLGWWAAFGRLVPPCEIIGC